MGALGSTHPWNWIPEGRGSRAPEGQIEPKERQLLHRPKGPKGGTFFQEQEPTSQTPKRINKGHSPRAHPKQQVASGLFASPFRRISGPAGGPEVSAQGRTLLLLNLPSEMMMLIWPEGSRGCGGWGVEDVFFGGWWPRKLTLAWTMATFFGLWGVVGGGGWKAFFGGWGVGGGGSFPFTLKNQGSKSKSKPNHRRKT